jgi:CBS domain-containing protein
MDPARPEPPPALASATLALGLREALRRYVPFAQMRAEHVDRFVAQASEAYFAPDEVIIQPTDGPVQALYFIRDGAVTGTRSATELYLGSFQYESGDLFPVAALMAERAVTATYTAVRDTFCLTVPKAAVAELAAVSPPFADLLNRRMLNFIDASRQAVQRAHASNALAEQSLERRLGDIATRTPAACAPATPVGEALRTMHEQRIGSMLVVDPAGAPLGILTRHDVLDRITLPQRPLATPIGEVMSAPVRTLTVDHTAHDAALLMSRHALRHVPVTREGRAVGIVSERDLFAIQRLSIRQLSSAIRAAREVGAMPAVAADLRRFAATLLAQGVQAKQLTELISHLNDLLTERLVELVAAEQGRDLAQACWIAFGSEGRSEQTVATDQDNGLIFLSDDPGRDRPGWLAFGRAVNEALDACGYPLCKGGIMAGNPDCCRTPAEWRSRFAHWIEHGSPEDLLAASIYFDLRPLAGAVALAEPLRDFIHRRAAEVPRFCRQLAEEVLRSGPPLDWLGRVETHTVDGAEVLDLKLHGTAIFVNVARLHALARGLPEVNTRRRFEALARALGLPERHCEAWVAAFEFLQMLRLRTQLEGLGPAGGAATPNLIRVDALNYIDRRILKESLRVARRLQQRIELDYIR